jgi:hypothetical protein
VWRRWPTATQAEPYTPRLTCATSAGIRRMLRRKCRSQGGAA